MSVIYLDYQSTTPCDPRVVTAMLPYFTEKFGNPHSRNHQYGWDAEEGVEQARQQVAALIGASPKEIIFTSGGTESNNLAIFGIVRALEKKAVPISKISALRLCGLMVRLVAKPSKPSLAAMACTRASE